MQPLSNYLDTSDLAVLLKVTLATILRRARSKPQSLSPPAALGPNFPLRWRQADAANWPNEVGIASICGLFASLKSWVLRVLVPSFATSQHGDDEVLFVNLAHGDGGNDVYRYQYHQDIRE